MKKIIVSLISIVLLSCVFCPVCAQKNKSTKPIEELIIRLNLRYINEQDFKFPSPSEAAKVFAKGEEILSKMAVESIVLDGISKQIDSGNKQEFPYLLYSNKTYKQDLKHYLDFYKQIVWKEDGIPDLTKAVTAKAYLAFYNLIHNKGNPSKLIAGRIDEHFPLLGVYSEDFAQLQDQFGNNEAYLWFTAELYNVPGRDRMIPKEDTEQAEKIAKEILYRDWQNYGMTKEQTDKWIDFATSWKNYDAFMPSINGGGAQQIVTGGNWCFTIFIRPYLPSGREYQPLGLTILHEFQHMKDFFPCRVQKLRDSLSELTTSLSDIVNADSIYRQIHNIPENQHITYKNEDVDLDEIARFFRNLSRKYKTDNYAKLLVTVEAKEYIENSYNKLSEYIASLELKKQGKNQVKSQTELRELGKKILHEDIEQIFKYTNRTDKVIPQ